MFEKTGKSKRGKQASIATGILFFGVLFQAEAQDTILLSRAMTLALENNLTVKQEVLKSEYQQALLKTSGDVPQTNFAAEIGQINSAYTDTRFGIAQSIPFPTVYSKQKSLNAQALKSVVLQVALKEEEVKRSVTQVFYTMLILKEKERLLLKADSVYSEWLMKADHRFSSGESNILEKATAEVQAGHIRVQLKSLRQEMEVSHLQFQLLLNTTIRYVPYAPSLKIENVILPDSSLIYLHPLVRLSEEQKLTAQQITKLEKAKGLPELSIGYFNTSMEGTGADDVYYPASKRFSAAQIGVGIPIFNGAQRARVAASKVNEVIADHHYQSQVQYVSTAYRQAHMQYLSGLEVVRYFEQEALGNAKLIRESADLQFEKGEIGFLDWVVLTHQTIAIWSEYFDACASLNESIITLNYLTLNQQ